jgi:hypothetical protein
MTKPPGPHEPPEPTLEEWVEAIAKLIERAGKGEDVNEAMETILIGVGKPPPQD